MATVEQIGGQTPDGMTLGKAATNKISFFGASPVVQQATATAPATTAATTTTPWGFATSTQANALVTLSVALKTALDNLGLTA